jgi:hypothetical protein
MDTMVLMIEVVFEHVDINHIPLVVALSGQATAFPYLDVITVLLFKFHNAI